ncbi:MAG: glycosyltransferase [Gemmatimonadetes bacterium]|nr:MAG: glycosyltransferase [Gemmatimonadota bacterium]
MKKPFVSVIIPAYFSNNTIVDCLSSLQQQEFMDFEVIVVNSSPEEWTAQIVTGQFPEVTFIQSKTRLFPHDARNRGVEHAQGELLVFTDPDCTYPPDWLTCLVCAYQNGHQVIVVAMGHQTKSWFENGVHLCKFFGALPGLPAGKLSIAPTANAAYSRSVWDQLGAFDGSIFAGDALQSWRATQQGFPPYFEPRAVVYHRHEGNLTSLWQERWIRGQEFLRERIKFYGWSRSKMVLYLIISPLLPFYVLIQTGLITVKSGWMGRFLWTLPVQFTGQAAWILGEARACWKALVSKPDP